MSTLTIQLPDELAERLLRVSGERQVAPSQVVSECLAQSLPALADDEAQAERRAWSARGKQSMSRVFGNDEPEYSAADAIP